MAQKFRVKTLSIKSQATGDSGLILENINNSTSATSGAANLGVDVNGKVVIAPVSTSSICDLDTITQAQANTLGLEDLKVVVCGTGDVNIDGKTVTLDKVVGLLNTLLKPVMGGSGTSTVSSIATTSASLSGSYTSDGGSTITATGFVVYPSGTYPYEIGSSFVMQYVDSSLTNPISVSATSLAPTTNYCARPYATNGVGTSYGDEICFTTNSVGYVTNLSSNSISLIDLSSLTNIGSITGVSAPLAGFIDKGYMYVGGGNNFITRIYLGDNSMSSINLGAQVSPIGSDDQYVYVGTGSNNTIHKIDKATLSVTATLGGITDIQSGVIEGQHMYVNGQGSNRVWKIDLSTFSVVSNVATGGSGAHRIALSGDFLYVTHYLSNELIKINKNTMSVISILSGFNTPYGITIEGGFAYVGNNGNASVSKIDLSSFTATSTVSTGNGPRYPLVKGGFLYVPCDSSNRVDKIDIATFTNTSNVGVGNFPCQFAVQQ